MKDQLKALFRTLPAHLRARYHSLYASVMLAIDDGDTEVIPELLALARPAEDFAAQAAFFEQVNSIIAAAD